MKQLFHQNTVLDAPPPFLSDPPHLLFQSNLKALQAACPGLPRLLCPGACYPGRAWPWTTGCLQPTLASLDAWAQSRSPNTAGTDLRAWRGRMTAHSIMSRLIQEAKDRSGTVGVEGVGVPIWMQPGGQLPAVAAARCPRVARGLSEDTQH